MHILTESLQQVSCLYSIENEAKKYQTLDGNVHYGRTIFYDNSLKLIWHNFLLQCRSGRNVFI